MNKLILIITLLCLSGCGAEATLSWVAPVARADGSPLLPSDIYFYNVRQRCGEYERYYETFDTSVRVALGDCVNRFAVQSVDYRGYESEWSGEVSL